MTERWIDGERPSGVVVIAMLVGTAAFALLMLLLAVLFVIGVGTWLSQ